MQLYLLGTGTCANQLTKNGKKIKNRFPPGYVLDWGENKILFEVSEGIRFRLEKAGFDYADFENIAISHCHPDHYNFMPYLQSVYCKGLWDQKGKQYEKLKIQILCPNQVAESYRKIFKLLVLEIKKNHYDFPEISFTKLGKMKFKTKIGRAQITVQEVHHGFGKVETLAFRVKVDNKIFAYSADTGDCQGIRKICKNADLFLCEASALIGQDKACRNYGHLTPYLAGKIAKESKVKKLLLTHYIGLDSESSMLKDCQRSGFEGEVKVGKDFEKVKI
ncbi:MAG: hypothetical protein GF335_04590 [Candidatus Moranbacteria bacterium]|nr:hypothetical protein [Candidatus Moranbacteria bacterium]